MNGIEKSLTALMTLTAMLFGCVSGPKDYLSYRSSSSPTATMSRMADLVGKCWFGDAAGAFAAYSYAPELNSFSGQPRVLIVEKDDPAGLPQLVISASREKRRTEVKLFGPLLAGGVGPRIVRNVEAWSGGSRSC